MLLEGPKAFQTEVEGESYAFDEIRGLAETRDATPGKAFYVDLDLRDALGQLAVEHEGTEFGIAEIDDDLHEAWVELIEQSITDLEVAARVWTSADWGEDFYASVKIDLPDLDNAKVQIAESNRQDLIGRYGTETPTLEQVTRAADEQLAQSKNPEIARAARDRLANPYRQPLPKPAVSSPAPDWTALLAPDGTPQATIHQRGYARGVAGKAMGNTKAPRIDYATVGQCKRIVGYFGGDVGEVDKRGGALLKTLWWVLLGLLGIVALIGVVTPPVGWILTGLIVWPFAQHYITRRKLQPPFGPQK
ncbi:hypothetical protein SEA_BRAN_29 [Corynebacterium phage Bran]|nr:hypothetical protein SEA_BRAN_29 [Corynebacterium phage Bran]